MNIVMAQHLPSIEEKEEALRKRLVKARRNAIMREYADPDFQIELKLAKEGYETCRRQGRKYIGPAFKIPHITYLWIDRTFPEVLTSHKELKKFLQRDSVLANFIIR
jgi:hypothetical protein